MNRSHEKIPPKAHTATESTSGDRTVLLSLYGEICKSHQAIDEFRMKLLGLLPLASLAGIFVLSRSELVSSTSGPSGDSRLDALVAFIAIFAALFTLALFVYEIRGILRCHDLNRTGRKIEEMLEVFGQFRVCQAEHEGAKENKRHRIFNAIVAACFVYSLVFAAWVFLALHNGFGLQNLHCMISAPASGLLLGLGAYWLVNEQIPA